MATFWGRAAGFYDRVVNVFGTPMQFVYVGLLLVTLAWPVVESAVLLVHGFSAWRLGNYLKLLFFVGQ